MSIETRTPEYRPGQWLTQCAYHPFTFWSGDTFRDAEGKIRCQQFCGQYRGSKTEREQNAIIAASHHLREAPSPPHTRPRPTGANHFAPYDRWAMQKTPARLEGDFGHDGIGTAATVVAGRRGPAFRFTDATAYEILTSEGAMPETGMAMAAWVSPTGTILGSVLTKGSTFNISAKVGAVDLVTGSVHLTGTLTAGWHHIAADWDGTTTTLYVNGLSVDSAAGGPTAKVRDLIEVGGGYVGDIYDARFFLRPFDAGELAEVMGT